MITVDVKIKLQDSLVIQGQHHHGSIFDLDFRDWLNSERLSHDAELIEVTPKIATPIGTHKYLTVTQIYSFAGPKRVRNCGHGS
jgi:hypothetical protein